MNILFCVEFYYPSLGGAQEVVRQLAEHMAANGHRVAVATSKITSRTSHRHNGVDIFEFAVAGNLVRGLKGEVESYRTFLSTANYDVVMFYAAQQWTFDAAWPVLQAIRGCKALVPCGYSGLYEPGYAQYFAELPEVLKRLDALVYHAEDYRDVSFGRACGAPAGVMIPNGADLEEFCQPANPSFRAGLKIPQSSQVLLTVGTITGLKGHLELVQAFALADFGGRHATLILNGNKPELSGKEVNVFTQLFQLWREYGASYALKHTLKVLLRTVGFEVGKAMDIYSWARRINRNQRASKRVIVIDLPRPQLIQAYLNADLFVFASNVEYSPLVLFESCAAGLPFLSVPVGNAAEIVRWTQGGRLCPAPKDARGYTHVDPKDLAVHIVAMLNDPDQLAAFAHQGAEASRLRYNWQMISREYEALFQRLLAARSQVSASVEGNND